MKKMLILLIFSALLLGGCASTKNYTSAGGGVYYSKPTVNVGLSFGLGWYSYPWSLGYGYGGYGYGYGHGWGGIHGVHYGRFSPYWGYPLYHVYRPHMYGPYLHSNYYAQARQYANHRPEHKSDHKKRKHKGKKKNPVRVVTLPGNRYGRVVDSYPVGGARYVSSASGNVREKSKSPPPQRIQPVDGAVIGASPTVKIIRRELQPEDAAYSVFSAQGSATAQRSASGGVFTKAGADTVQRLHGSNNKLVSEQQVRLPGVSPDSGRSMSPGTKPKSQPVHRSSRKANYKSRPSKAGRHKGSSSSRRGHSSGTRSH